MYLPDITGDTYRTSPERRKRFSRNRIFKGAFWFYSRLIFLVIWSSIKTVFSKNPQETINLQSNRTLRIAERQGADLCFEGLNSYPIENAPYVFACNHMSIMEITSLVGLVGSRIPVTFVVKSVLMKIPAISRILKSLNAIPVERKNPGKDLMRVLERGSELLSQGTSIILFPEGARCEEFKPENFNSLAVKLAVRAGVPIVPIAIKTDFWGIGKFIRGIGPIRPERTVHIKIGKPIYPKGRGKAENQEIIKFIENNMIRWKETE